MASQSSPSPPPLEAAGTADGAAATDIHHHEPSSLPSFELHDEFAYVSEHDTDEMKLSAAANFRHNNSNHMYVVFAMAMGVDNNRYANTLNEEPFDSVKKKDLRQTFFPSLKALCAEIGRRSYFLMKMSLDHGETHPLYSQGTRSILKPRPSQWKRDKVEAWLLNPKHQLEINDQDLLFFERQIEAYAAYLRRELKGNPPAIAAKPVRAKNVASIPSTAAISSLSSGVKEDPWGNELLILRGSQTSDAKRDRLLVEGNQKMASVMVNLGKMQQKMELDAAQRDEEFHFGNLYKAKSALVTERTGYVQDLQNLRVQLTTMRSKADEYELKLIDAEEAGAERKVDLLLRRVDEMKQEIANLETEADAKKQLIAGVDSRIKAKQQEIDLAEADASRKRKATAETIDNRIPPSSRSRGV